MKVKLRLFFDWGIRFEEPYILQEQGNRTVAYAKKDELENAILVKYRPDVLEQREQDRLEVERARAAIEAKWNQDQEFEKQEISTEETKGRKTQAKKGARPMSHHSAEELHEQGKPYDENDE